MKLIALFSLLFLSLNAICQDFLVGARTGIGKNLFIYDSNVPEPTRLTWDKQIFVRYQAKKRLSIELNMSNYAYTDPNAPIPICVFGADYTITNISERYKYYSFALALQYDVSLKKWRQRPILKNFRSYFGIAAGPTFVDAIATEDIRKDGLPDTRVYKYRYVSMIQIGVNHSLVYQLTNHINLSSMSTYTSDMAGFYGAYRVENHFSYQLGLGYKL